MLETAMTVLLTDRESNITLPTGKSVRVVKRAADLNRSRDVRNLFVLASASTLDEASQVIRSPARKNPLRALFVRADLEVSWLLSALVEADIRSLRNVIFHDASGALPRRVLNAWSIGAQNALIADAKIDDGDLVVRSCAFEQLRVPLGEVPGLRGMTSSEAEDFEVSSSGSYLHWPSRDVHLGLDSLKYLVDAGFRDTAEAARLAYNERFGSAVAALRKSRGLKQSQIPGLSTRQVGRIERGESETPRIQTLERLANAHGWPLREYLSQLSSIIEGLHPVDVGSPG